MSSLRVILGFNSEFLANDFQSVTDLDEIPVASIKGKVDNLQGLKENVIVGRLVPAGTGLTKMAWDNEARKQDKLRLEELKKQQIETPQTSE